MQVPSAINLAVFVLLSPLPSSSLLLLHFWTMPRYSAFWPLGTIDSIWMVEWCCVCMWRICTWVVVSVGISQPKTVTISDDQQLPDSPGESSAPRYLGGLGCSGWGGLSDHLFNFRPKEHQRTMYCSRDVYEILGVACEIPVLVLDPFDAYIIYIIYINLSWSPDPKPFIVMCLWDPLGGGAGDGWRMLDIPLWTTRSSSWSLHLSNMPRFIPKKMGFRDGGPVSVRISPGIRVPGFYNAKLGTFTSVLEKRLLCDSAGGLFQELQSGQHLFARPC